MDECDCAQIYIEAEMTEAIRAIRAQMVGVGLTPAQTECDACGDEIPEARRLAVPGCRLCVKCQLEIERAGK
jgi:phage/conjugal plasmid C-4 type zinc finger TraR family protein